MRWHVKDNYGWKHTYPEFKNEKEAGEYLTALDKIFEIGDNVVAVKVYQGKKTWNKWSKKKR